MTNPNIILSENYKIDIKRFRDIFGIMYYHVLLFMGEKESDKSVCSRIRIQSNTYRKQLNSYNLKKIQGVY